MDFLIIIFTLISYCIMDFLIFELYLLIYFSVY